MTGTQTFPPNNKSLKGTLQTVPLGNSKDRLAYIHELFALPMGPALFFFVFVLVLTWLQNTWTPEPS